MPRVLISDTEAFAPRPVAVQQEKSEDQTLKDLEKLKLGFQIAGAAAPFAGMAVSGLDKYLYSPISEKVKEHFKTGREKEYYGKGVGEQLLEEGAAPSAAAVAPGAGGAAPGVGAAIPPADVTKAIAKQRLEAQKPRDLQESARVLNDLVEQRTKTIDEGRIEDLPALNDKIEKAQAAKEELERYKLNKPEEGKVGISTPNVFDERGRVRTPERPYTKVGQEAFKKAPEMLAAQRGKQSDEARRQKMGHMLAMSPVQRGTGEVSVELPELEESLAGKYVEPIQQVEPYKTREVPAPPAAGAVPAGRKPFVDPVSGKVQTGYLEQMPPAKSFAGVPAGAPSEAKTIDLMEMVRGKKPAEGPKTLGNASEDELNKAKYKLQYLVDQKKADPTAAAAVAQAQNRIDLIDKELQHRVEFIPFEEWAARARAAETPAEQAEVMRQAERVGMPVSDLADLFKTRVQRGKALALGTREEPGLFPQLARPLSEAEEEFKRLKIAAMAEGYNAKQAETIAKTELAKARAGRAEAQTRETEMLAGFRAGELAEKMMWLHAKHENLEKKTAAEIARLKEDANRLRAVASGTRSMELAKWFDLWNKRGDSDINTADKNLQDAETAAEHGQLNADKAMVALQQSSLDLSKLQTEMRKLDPDAPGYNAARAKLAEDMVKAQAQVDANKEAASLAQMRVNRYEQTKEQARYARDLASQNREQAHSIAVEYSNRRRQGFKMAPVSPEKPSRLPPLSERAKAEQAGTAPAAGAPAAAPAKKPGAKSLLDTLE